LLDFRQDLLVVDGRADLCLDIGLEWLLDPLEVFNGLGLSALVGMELIGDDAPIEGADRCDAPLVEKYWRALYAVLEDSLGEILRERLIDISCMGAAFAVKVEGEVVGEGLLLELDLVVDIKLQGAQLVVQELALVQHLRGVEVLVLLIGGAGHHLPERILPCSLRFGVIEDRGVRLDLAVEVGFGADVVHAVELEAWDCAFPLQDLLGVFGEGPLRDYMVLFMGRAAFHIAFLLREGCGVHLAEPVGRAKLVQLRKGLLLLAEFVLDHQRRDLRQGQLVQRRRLLQVLVVLLPQLLIHVYQRLDEDVVHTLDLLLLHLDRQVPHSLL